MYFIFTFQTGQNSTNIEAQISQIIQNSGFNEIVNPMPNTYIIRCNSNEARGQFVNRMLNLARSSGNVRYLVSPLIESTSLNAFVSQNYFEGLRQVTASHYGGGLAF